MNPDRNDLCLPTLSGSSLLGFLAALGTFRTLAETPGISDLRMKWIPMANSYAPLLTSAALPDDDQLVGRLHSALSKFSDHPSITADNDLTIPLGRFRALATSAARDFLAGTDSMGAAMVAAFGCDAVGNDAGNIEDTAFRTMSGAGHQHFLKFMNDLAKGTTPEQIHEALFGPWRYRDPSPIMRWDSEDDRRYALRWDEPSKDPVRSVRGANRLAVAALPLFPVVPDSRTSVATTGFTGRGRRDTFVNWPIWSEWLTLDAIRSLLGMSDIQEQSPRANRSRSARGICAVYRSQRITLGKFRNFTPAAAWS